MQVELFVSCKNLPNVDVLSKTDAVVKMLQSIDEVWTVVGQTEVVWNNLNPHFTRTFVVDYEFEVVQRLRFEVYDVDRADEPLRNLLGSVHMTVGNIAGSRGQTLEQPIGGGSDGRVGGANCGTLRVRLEEIKMPQDTLILALRGLNLQRVPTWFGLGSKAPTTFVAVSRLDQTGTDRVVVARSGEVRHDRSPVWPKMEITIHKLCHGDMSRPFRIEIYRYKRSGNHILLSTQEVTFAQLLQQQQQQQLTFSNFKVIEAKVKAGPAQVHSFLHYLHNGCQISLITAIDCTASNGRLHDVIEYGDGNPYEQALSAVGEILCGYDHDQQFPLYGFGGVPPLSPNGRVSHCFPLDPQRPVVSSLEEMLAVYRRHIKRIVLSGPTRFSSVVEKAVEQATHAHNVMTATQQEYTVLLILTDGVIEDMDATIRLLVKASPLPLSVIIIGVGNADFTLMRRLDGDDTPLSSTSRDITQFVEFNNFRGDPTGLAKEVLAEIPRQVIDYMQDRCPSSLPVMVDTVDTFITPSMQPPPYVE